MYDLHVHSTASDGTLSPEELIKEAISLGLSGIAITDHDTTDGLEIAEEFIKNHMINLEFIPGIEMNTEMGENEVHILGYYIDYNNQSLQERLRDIRSQRQQRAQKMVNKLCELGLKIDYEDVKSLATDLVARPHIAMAMVNAGYVDNIKEAFNKYIGKGQSAYVNRYKFTPNEAINMIKQAGGIAVLAHPGLIADQNLIPNIIDMGIKGLEVYYPEHDNEQTENYLNLARNHGLLITGGSDFHGFNSSESRAQLGSAGINQVLMSKLNTFIMNN